ncbi:MAG: hypothetical protein R3C68_08655 [Myxococcota bacterium]
MRIRKTDLNLGDSQTFETALTTLEDPSVVDLCRVSARTRQGQTLPSAKHKKRIPESLTIPYAE